MSPELSSDRRTNDSGRLSIRTRLGIVAAIVRESREDPSMAFEIVIKSGREINVVPNLEKVKQIEDS